MASRWPSVCFRLPVQVFVHHAPLSLCLLVTLLLCYLHEASGQTEHYTINQQTCRGFFHRIPSAVIQGVGGMALGSDVCELVLAAPGRAVWMLRIENDDILDCDVVITIFAGRATRKNNVPLLVHKCAWTNPGIVFINSSMLTIRLHHHNATKYSFTIVVTARKIVSSADDECVGFRCDNDICISKTLICDYVDNCFDYSDEAKNGTAHCYEGFWPFQGENWGVLASVLGAGLVFGVTAACCRHIRQRQQSSVDDLYDLNGGPYVHRYAYRYAIIRPPKKANTTNVVLGKDGHMHYNATKV